MTVGWEFAVTKEAWTFPFCGASEIPIPSSAIVHSRSHQQKRRFCPTDVPLCVLVGQPACPMAMLIDEALESIPTETSPLPTHACNAKLKYSVRLPLAAKVEMLSTVPYASSTSGFHPPDGLQVRRCSNSNPSLQNLLFGYAVLFPE